MHRWKIIALILIGFLSGIIFMYFDYQFIGEQMVGTKPVNFGFVDLASIALTAATVVLGGVALIVSFVSIFGFQFIRKSAIEAAKREMDKLLSETFEEVVEEMIVKKLSDYGYQPRDKVTEKELHPDFDKDDDGER